MTTIVQAILAIFLAIAEWLGTAFTTLQAIFWTSGIGLTFIGTLSVMGLAFAVIFLIFGMLRSFLKFR